MSYLLPHLTSGWACDQAILSEENRLVVLRFGHDYDPTCMQMDEVLYSIAELVKNYSVIYLVDTSEVPDFNTMYELYDPCTVMFFYRNKVNRPFFIVAYFTCHFQFLTCCSHHLLLHVCGSTPLPSTPNPYPTPTQLSPTHPPYPVSSSSPPPPMRAPSYTPTEQQVISSTLSLPDCSCADVHTWQYLLFLLSCHNSTS